LLGILFKKLNGFKFFRKEKDMEDKVIIRCPCGQENQLIRIDGVLHYDVTRHGNGEPCGGLCFNCRSPLVDEKVFGADVPEPAGPGQDDAGSDVPSMAMKKAELVALAEDMGVEVPANATKGMILGLIGQGGEDVTGEDEQPAGD
jgi:hypothetical protein